MTSGVPSAASERIGKEAEVATMEEPTASQKSRIKYTRYSRDSAAEKLEALITETEPSGRKLYINIASLAGLKNTFLKFLQSPAAADIAGLKVRTCNFAEDVIILLGQKQCKLTNPHAIVSLVNSLIGHPRFIELLEGNPLDPGLQKINAAYLAVHQSLISKANAEVISVNTHEQVEAATS